MSGTNVTIASGLLTVLADTTSFGNLFSANVTFSGFATATFLNGQTVQVVNASATQIEALTAFADYPSAADTGTIQVQNWFNQVASVTGQCTNALLLNTCADFVAPLGFAVGTETSYQAGGAEDTVAPFEYGVNAPALEYATRESAQYIAESSETVSPNHFAYKVGNAGGTPWWWTYGDGTEWTRNTYTQVLGTTVGACTGTISDCSASLYSYSWGVGGPPVSGTVNVLICATGPDYDTVGYSWTGTPSCSGQQITVANTFGSNVGYDVNVIFASATGHSVGQSATIPVTVTQGTQVSPTGGSYFQSNPLGAPANPPTVVSTCTGTCATSWAYNVVPHFNGATALPSPTQSVADGADTLDGSNFETITMPLIRGATDCVVQRLTVGTSPTTTGYLVNGSSVVVSAPCDGFATIADVGLVADGAVAATLDDLTGGVVESLFSAPYGSLMSFWIDGSGSAFFFGDKETDNGGVSMTSFGVAVGMGGITLGSPVGVTIGQVNVGDLPTAASYAGHLLGVGNSTAIVTEGQLCVGAGTTAALAFSDGTQWKCF